MNEKEEKEKYEFIWKHNEYRRYSPGLYFALKYHLLENLQKLNVKSILDVGCGSGKLMKHLIDTNLFLKVHGMDIAKNCLDPKFVEESKPTIHLGTLWKPSHFPTTYDAIICTDVMEHIPEEHVRQSIKNIFNHCRLLAFFSIDLTEDLFGPNLLNTPLHLTVKPSHWWLDCIEESGFFGGACDIFSHNNEEKTLILYALKNPKDLS